MDQNTNKSQPPIWIIEKVDFFNMSSEQYKTYDKACVFFDVDWKYPRIMLLNFSKVTEVRNLLP